MIDRARFTYFRGLPAPNVSEETGNCVLLWRVVIDQIVEDLINEPRNREEVEAQKAARFWLMETPCMMPIRPVLMMLPT